MKYLQFALLILFFSLNTLTHERVCFAGHPELQKLFTDLALEGDPDDPILASEVIHDPSLLNTHRTLRLKKTIQSQLIQLGFTYLKDHDPSDYGVILRYTESHPQKIRAIDFFNFSKLPIQVRIHPSGTLFVQTCFIGQKTLELFQGLIAHWKVHGSVNPPDYSPILQAGDSALIRSIDLSRLILKAERHDAEDASILELSYRLSVDSEIEMEVTSDGVLSISCLHTWVPGVKSRMSHCRSLGYPLPMLFEN